jgi:pimeloyl-ACP methyl ester carboxylesterase
MLPLDRRHRFDGQEVAWGRMGNGPALVLIHGTPFSSQVWRRIAPLLAGRWTVYYFDLLGYGLSDMRDQQDVSLSVQNRLLASLFADGKLIVPMCSAMISAARRLYAAISSTDSGTTRLRSSTLWR